MRTSEVLSLAGAGLRYLVLAKLMRRAVPLVGGIVINDSCNLHCLQCGVANRGIPDLTFEEVRTGLLKLHDMSLRVLYVEGGEPFLWHDGDRNLEDIVALARELGFTAVIVYTNGTFPISTEADTLYVSLDGLKVTNDRLRGESYDRVIGNINDSSHPNILINFTINGINMSEIEQFCEQMQKVAHVRGIFFYFVTPTGDNAELVLNPFERSRAAARLLALKRRGAPVRNSAAALRRVRDDTWRRPVSLCYLYADRIMYRCCRSIGNAAACDQCGYLGYAELDCIARLRFGAIREAFGALSG